MAYLFPRAVQFHAGFGPEWECTARAQGEPTCIKKIGRPNQECVDGFAERRNAPREREVVFRIVGWVPITMRAVLIGIASLHPSYIIACAA
jgi:hypothetical protein